MSGMERSEIDSGLINVTFGCVIQACLVSWKAGRPGVEGSGEGGGGWGYVCVCVLGWGG